MIEDDDSNSEKQDMNTCETFHSLMMDANQSNNEKSLSRSGINMTKSNKSQGNDKALLSKVRKDIFFKFISWFHTLMIHIYKSNSESEVETELEEDGRATSQKTNDRDFFGVSQDPPDKEKVLMIVKKNIKNFLSFDDGRWSE